MTWRTPSSLKWLIVKHSRLQGELELLQRQSTELDRQAAEQRQRVDEAKRNLQAIERALGLHDIKVDPNDIQGVQPHVEKPLYKHGDLSRLILSALKSTDGWLSTGDVVRHATGYTYDNIDHEMYEKVRRTFRKRMRALVIKGMIERQIGAGHRDHTLWRLPQHVG